MESASNFVSTEFSYGTTSFLEVKDDKTSPNLQKHIIISVVRLAYVKISSLKRS